MRKVFMVVCLLIIMVETASAFTLKNEPLGWNGWAWETPLQDVQGWLGFAGNLSIPQLSDIDAALFVRQGESNRYFDSDWKATYYIFKDKKLCGVLLETDRAMSASASIVNYMKNLNENTYIQGPEVQGKGVMFVYAIARGTYASYLQISDPSTGIFKRKFYVLIGSAKIVNEWIEQVLLSVPKY